MARGATILAELAGVGMSADASDIVAPTVEGPAAAMRACLADAGLNPEDVDYLNAHGTGTKANDQIETVAIKQVFGDQAKKLSVSSTKSMHAHCLGASGALEMIACVKAIAALARKEATDEVISTYSGENLEFGPDYMIPKPFDPRLITEVTIAVAKAAMESGVAVRPIEDWDAYKQKLQQYFARSTMAMTPKAPAVVNV